MTLEYILYDVTFEASDLILKLYCRSLKFGCTEVQDGLCSVISWCLCLTWNCFASSEVYSKLKALITKCVLFPYKYIQFSYAYSWEFFYVFLSWFFLVSHVSLNSISSPTVNRVQKKPGLKMFVKFYFLLNLPDTEYLVS